MVPNLDIHQTETELLEGAFNKGGRLPTAQAPEIRQTPIDELGREHRVFAMCFPTSILYSSADWYRGRIRSLSLADGGDTS